MPAGTRGRHEETSNDGRNHHAYHRAGEEGVGTRRPHPSAELQKARRNRVWGHRAPPAAGGCIQSRAREAVEAGRMEGGE